MKKTLVILAAIATAGIASADISAALSNSGGIHTVAGGYGGQFLVQLVYSAGATASTDASGYDIDVLNIAGGQAGETILASLTTSAGYAGTWGPGAATAYAQSTAGSLTVRVFDAADMGVGSTFLSFDIDVDGALTTYDALTPSTIYNTDGLLGGEIQGTSHAVIPEPATLGLMGVAGLGMFLTRRKNRC